MAATQQQSKPKKDKPVAESYAAAVTGQPATQPRPIGAKIPKAPAQPPSGAIGAPIGARAPARASAGKPPVGTPATAKQGSVDQQDANVTSESALEFLANAPGDHTFADYQAAKDSKAASDTQAAQSTELAPPKSQSATQAQDAGELDFDDEDDAVMQKVLWESRQQAQQQGADPTASSSTGGTATPARTIDEFIQFELELGRDYQREANFLEDTMSKRRLTSSEVDRLRKVSELINVNKQRVVELCQLQVRENQAKQARDTSAMLASLKPLQPTRAKPAVQKAGAPSTMPPPLLIVKHPPGDGRKAPPPVLTPPLPPPIKPPPTPQQLRDQSDSGSGPPPGTLPITKFSGGSLAAPTSPKGPSTAQRQRPLISPKGRPPPIIALPSQQSSQSGAHVAAMSSPRSVATEDTADLENRLERKREAKRQLARAQEGDGADDGDTSKHPRRSHHQEEEHRSSRDTRRKKRSTSDQSQSPESSDGDNRSTSTKGSRSRRHERSRRHRSRSRRGSRSRRRQNTDSSDEERRSRSDKRKDEYKSSKHRKRRDDSPSPSQQEEDRSKDRSSQQPQSQADQEQQRAKQSMPQPAMIQAPTAQPQPAAPVAQHAQPVTAGQVQAQVARPAQAQLLATHAIGSTISNLPIAKAMPIQQQPQGQALTQPLPRPVFPPSSAMIQVPARPQAQQLAAPPDLGTDLERTQAAQIQQMQQQMAQLEARLHALQAPVPQRQASQSPSGSWGWNEQANQSQWHGHGWQDWGNGRGYQ